MIPSPTNCSLGEVSSGVNPSEGERLHRNSPGDQTPGTAGVQSGGLTHWDRFKRYRERDGEGSATPWETPPQTPSTRETLPRFGY